MNYRKLAINLTDLYWDKDSNHKVWGTVKKLRKKAYKKSFPNNGSIDTKSDMYLRLYE